MQTLYPIKQLFNCKSISQIFLIVELRCCNRILLKKSCRKREETAQRTKVSGFLNRCLLSLKHLHEKKNFFVSIWFQLKLNNKKLLQNSWHNQLRDTCRNNRSWKRKMVCLFVCCQVFHVSCHLFTVTISLVPPLLSFSFLMSRGSHQLWPPWR